MSDRILSHLPKGRLSPLWIVGLFVSIVEIVVTVAIIQTTGGVQGWLTFFAIIFAFYIATAFFLILWFRNHVFYGPSEFDAQDPTKFVSGMQGHLKDDAELLSKISDIVRTNLTSGDVASELQMAQGQGKTDEALQQLADRTVNDIKQQASIVLELGKEFRKMGGFFPLLLLINPSMILVELVEIAQEASSARLDSRDYGKEWVFRDKADPRKYFMHRSHPEAYLHTSLDVIGIEPGMIVEIAKVPSATAIG